MNPLEIPLRNLLHSIDQLAIEILYTNPDDAHDLNNYIEQAKQALEKLNAKTS